MDYKEVQLQYQGYLNTPNLWFGNCIYNLEQLEYKPIKSISFQESLPKGIRLGKRVEQFVFHELKQLPWVSFIAENIQIQKEKHTIGEIDMLLLINNQPIHLEIIYKFYIYDASAGTHPLDHWIGPNRKDSLVEKLNKLKNIQLPLLYRPETLPYLQKLHLEVSNIAQYVLFKAQLFVPYSSKKISHNMINPACLVGVYLKKDNLSDFTDCKFYIPSKSNWLIKAHSQVTWQSHPSFITDILPILEKQTSPLVWIKHPNGQIDTCFLVWW